MKKILTRFVKLHHICLVCFYRCVKNVLCLLVNSFHFWHIPFFVLNLLLIGIIVGEEASLKCINSGPKSFP